MRLTQSGLSHLECWRCQQHHSPMELHTVCRDCSGPLKAVYDLQRLADQVDRSSIQQRSGGMWRWRELLPLMDPACRFSLGEGSTPLLKASKVTQELALTQLYIKDEGLNPTGSFKARGLAVAVSKAMELGAPGFVIPTAGNAGSALATYAARAGRPAHVFMPRDAHKAYQLEVAAAGASLHLVDGLIDEAGRQASAKAQENGFFNVATFREPYRVEGKKTMGLELAEAFQWSLPEVILYPTGGGTGLVGMWKAFDELEALGWIGADRPRMISVQAQGCAPVVRAINQGADRIEPWLEARTEAAGLRVPGVFADVEVLHVIRQSGGTAVAVSEAEISSAQRLLAAQEGVLACREGAATLAALPALIDRGLVKPADRIVLFNTATGLKELA